MNSIFRYFILLFSCLNVASGFSQPPYKGEITVRFTEKEQQKDTVFLQASVEWLKFRLPSNSVLTWTPSLQSLDGLHEYLFESFQVAGKNRMKYLLREEYFRNRKKPRVSNPHLLSQTGLNTPVSIPITIAVPFEEWMLHSRMVLTENVTGCNQGCEFYEDCLPFRKHIGPALFFPEPFVPEFKVIYLPVPLNEKKLIRETYSAHLSFRVNQVQLIRQFGNNERVLAEVDLIIDRAKKDTLVRLQHIQVVGYASPEGNAGHNQRLSEGRAQALVNYLFDQYPFLGSECTVTAQGRGEDWAGLRKAVEEQSYLNDKDRVLQILDYTDDIELRKSRLKALSGGRTYKTMLDDLYPPLRRNEYTLDYEVRGFTAEEARALLYKRPQLLSLEELWMVATLYDSNTAEYKEVFEIAANLYRDSEIAQFNVGAMEIETGSYDRAIQRFEKIGSAESLNNIGVAYWYKKEYEQAYHYLQSAASKGNTQALDNLREFENWTQSLSVKP